MRYQSQVRKKGRKKTPQPQSKSGATMPDAPSENNPTKPSWPAIGTLGLAVLSMLDCNRSPFGLYTEAITAFLPRFGFLNPKAPTVSDEIRSLAKLGAVQQKRGAWRITDAGVSLLEREGL